MNRSPWNTNTIATLVFLVSFMIGIIVFYFVGGYVRGGPLNSYLILGIVVVLFLLMVIYLILVYKGKIVRSEPDYRQLFILGLVFLPLGFSSDNSVFLIFSLVFIGVGLANKNKWIKQERFSDLSPEQKKFRIFLILLLGVLVLTGFVVWSRFDKFKNQGSIRVANFKECAEAGNPIMESYPRKCSADGQIFVEDLESVLTKDEAFFIAGGSDECAETGILTEIYVYNQNTKTWWIDLERMPELEKDGCNPACVVNELNKTAEVNWRCTGLNPPQ